jgi:hypothetical protein
VFILSNFGVGNPIGTISNVSRISKEALPLLNNCEVVKRDTPTPSLLSRTPASVNTNPLMLDLRRWVCYRRQTRFIYYSPFANKLYIPCRTTI